MSSFSSKKNILIIGGGPAGMIAAYYLSKHCKVHLYEKGKTLGRKFLVAGKGGFNLTNSKTGEDLFNKYTPTSFLKPILKEFDSYDTINWLKEIGIPTYTGSSGRVFPKKGIKPIEVLNAIKTKILDQGVSIHYGHEFISFDTNSIQFKHQENIILQKFDECVFALGGASWSVTGSEGNWISIFEKKDILTIPFQPSNCGLNIDFPKEFIEKLAGNPLKNIRITCNKKTVKGEALVSSYGLEGNAIYPIAAEVRNLLNKESNAFITIDFKPFNTEKELLNKITATTIHKNYKYIFNLDKTQLAILKAYTDKKTYLTPTLFVKKIKQLEIPVKSLRIVEEAISTVGGIALDELNSDLSLKKHPNIYITGEMFDWDTITGGYLLQGCFATGVHAAKSILAKSSRY